METYELTGSGATGIVVNDDHMRAISRLPVMVKCGRREPLAPPAGVLQFHNYILQSTNSNASHHYPASTRSRLDRAAASIDDAFLNDALGDCSIAAVQHLLGIWSANDTDSGGLIIPSRDNTLTNYRECCGPGDPGCFTQNVMLGFMNPGLAVGNDRLKIDGWLYCLLEPALAKAAIYCLGGTYLGFHLPPGWRNSDTWDVSNYSPGGPGHAVAIVAYDAGGVYALSWRRIYYITWAGLDALPKTFATEHIVMLAPSWYGPDRVNSATGIDLAGLRFDIDSIAQRLIVPEIPNMLFTGSIKSGDVPPLYMNWRDNQLVSVTLTLPPPPFTAVDRGVVNEDKVGTLSPAPDGRLDRRLDLGNLKPLALKNIVIFGDVASVKWYGTFNGTSWVANNQNWTLTVDRNALDPTAALYFGNYSQSAWHVTVTYADNTSDSVDVDAVD